MANIATLVVSLASNSAKLIQGLKLGERAAKVWAASMRKIADKVKNFFKGIVSGGINVMKKALLGLPAAFAGISAALGVKAKDVRELQNMAEVLGVSTTALQEWQYAAKKVGIEGDKLTEIFRDTSDKIGDFIQTGGGSAADMFEQLNIKAADFVNLSPDQALLKLAAATENLNKQDKIFFFEAIASDASNLIPLLENNGKGLANLAEQAQKTGNVLSNDQLNGLSAYGKSWGMLVDKIKGFWNQISAAIAPAFTVLTTELNQYIDKLGGIDVAAQRAGQWLIEMGVAGIKGGSAIVGAMDGVKVALMVAHQWSLKLLQTIGLLAEFGGKLTPFKRISDNLQKALSVDGRTFAGGFAEAMKQEIAIIDKELAQIENRQMEWGAREQAIDDLAERMRASIANPIDKSAETTKGNTSATDTNTTAIQENNGNLQSLLKGINAQNELLGKKDGTGDFGAINVDRIFGTGDEQKQLKSSDSFEGFAKIAATKINSGDQSQTNLRQVASVISTLERQILAYSKMRGYDTKGMQAVVDKLKKDAEAMAGATKQQIKPESTETIFERLKGIAEAAQAGADALKPAVDSIAEVTKDGITNTYNTAVDSVTTAAQVTVNGITTSFETTKQGVISITNQAVESIRAASGSNRSAESANKSKSKSEMPDLGSLDLSLDMSGQEITTKIFTDSRSAKALKAFISKHTNNTARAVAN